MRYSENEIYKFKKAIKEAKIDDFRYDYYSSLGDGSLLYSIFDNIDYQEDALQEIKEYIAKDDEIINYLIHIFDANYGLNFDEDLEIELELLKSENDYKADAFITLEVKVLINDEWYSEDVKFLWRV